MARMLGPTLAQRFMSGVSGGESAVLYAAAGSDPTLAEIRSYPDGTAVTGSTLTVDAHGMLPMFYFPEGSRSVYVSVSGGTRVQLTPETGQDRFADLNSVLDARLDTHAHGQFGDGSDGAVVMDGTNTFATFASKNSGTYTLTRDVLASDLTVGAGVTLVAAGFKIYVSGTLTVAATGKIHNDGANAVADAAGAAAVAGTVSGGTIGGAGGTGAGNAGTNIAAKAFGGAGGAGGACGGTAAGAGGTVAVPTAAQGGLQAARVTRWAMTGTAVAAGALQHFVGGAGGGSGAGDGANKGGGGGGGGGVCILNARTVVNNGTLSAAGGNGAAGVAGNAGGGGGGGGGLLIVNTTAYSGSGSRVVMGGALAAGVGTGSSGVAGTGGTSVLNLQSTSVFA